MIRQWLISITGIGAAYAPCSNMNSPLLKLAAVVFVVLLFPRLVLANPGPPVNVPEAGSTVLLLLASLGGMGVAGRFLFRNRK